MDTKKDAKMKDTKATPPDPERVMLAIFALLAAEREERTSSAEPRTVAAILATTGFTASEVQKMTGANIKTIESRMRKVK
jgi:DNA-directed RNA polymerase specialized sigma24 family protein